MVDGNRTSHGAVTRYWIIRVGTRIHDIRGIIAEVGNTFLLTGLTVTETEFEVREPVDFSELVLVFDTPCKGERGEHTPLLVVVRLEPVETG